MYRCGGALRSFIRLLFPPWFQEDFIGKMMVLGFGWFNGVKKLKRPQPNRQKSMETTRMRRSTYENIHPSTPFTPPPGWSHGVKTSHPEFYGAEAGLHDFILLALTWRLLAGLGISTANSRVVAAKTTVVKTNMYMRFLVSESSPLTDSSSALRRLLSEAAA